MEFLLGVCHHELVCMIIFVLSQEHIGSLLDSVTAYTQKESEDELEQLLSDLAYQCQQNPRLRDQVKNIVYDFPSVVSVISLHLHLSLRIAQL